MKNLICTPIAVIHNDFKEKFGLPRQSGLSVHLLSEIIMEPPYRNPDAFRGIEDFERLWLLWEFSEAKKADGWSPTVRPPRLGGNQRMGVFATRSPFRPNAIGLTCVKLEKFEITEKYGPVLTVSGADLMDGTPILDIKPYLPYADSYPDAAAGFTAQIPKPTLQIVWRAAVPPDMTPAQRLALEEALADDPRPAYQNDPVRVYGMAYGSWNVKFVIDGAVATVCEISEMK
ncbi:MAG: tRNA (N6-threonylcarbamoyladenosine(37)-N6)-methyltransferase TrmO [Clostridia bacterium]|nr:tRNA (N6-threonylcarbamoyladenosine(37)-N6)-methyltransferase TrmO [Clostridia bacterium]